MYFSAKEFHAAVVRGAANINRRASAAFMHRNYGWGQEQYNRAVAGGSYIPHESVTGPSVTLAEAAAYLKAAKNAIITRTYRLEDGTTVSTKWYRPWDIVPALANWRPPQGDYGVGVEIEMGFRSVEVAARIADQCKNWRYVTADHEGGSYPIEMTFPPVKYSALNLKRSAMFRYLDILTANRDDVVQHASGNMVGTHINVSTPNDSARIGGRMSRMGQYFRESMSAAEQNRFFGRRPYGGIYHHTNAGNGASFYELKLFNSTIDKNRLAQYIHIGVAILQLAESQQELTHDNIVAALERGLAKTNFKVVPLEAPASSSARAARAA